jgi:hypothetical protein
LHEEETATLRVNHAEIGAYLLGLWGLPAEIVEATGGHHAPGQTVFATEFSLLAAVHAANVFAHETGGQTDGLCLPQLDLDYYKMIQLEDQLATWRECCTGEQPPAPDKIALSGAPATTPAKTQNAVIAPAADNAMAVTTTASAVVTRAGSDIQPSASPNKTPRPVLPPLIKPLTPISPPVASFAYGWVAIITLFLVISGIVLWHFHGRPDSVPNPETATAPVQTEASAMPVITAPTVAPIVVATIAPPVAIVSASSAPPKLAATPAPVMTPKKAPASPFDKIHVQGIFYRAANPLAIINGQTAGIGDRISDIQVSEISQHSVTLSFKGEQKTFKFN